MKKTYYFIGLFFSLKNKKKAIKEYKEYKNIKEKRENAERRNEYKKSV